MSPRVVSLVAVSLLLSALAAPARADEPKVYRWVGRDGRVYTSNAPPKAACGRYGAYVASWRDAQQSIESWQATIDRLQSRTDNFVRRNDTTYSDSLDRANERLDEARARASRLESEGRAAGVPESCLTE